MSLDGINDAVFDLEARAFRLKPVADGMVGRLSRIAKAEVADPCCQAVGN